MEREILAGEGEEVGPGPLERHQRLLPLGQVRQRRPGRERAEALGEQARRLAGADQQQRLERIGGERAGGAPEELVEAALVDLGDQPPDRVERGLAVGGAGRERAVHPPLAGQRRSLPEAGEDEPDQLVVAPGREVSGSWDAEVLQVLRVMHVHAR